MYNGIGLETPRGSGTNGFVQRNMAFVRPRKEKVDYRTEEELAKSEASLNREPNLEILEHERKRKIEIDCLELREMLEVQNFDEKEIELKVDAFRATQLKKLKMEKPEILLDESGRPIASGTHEIAAANQTRNKKLRDAFGISAEYVDGSSMDPARHQRELDARSKRYALVKDPEDDLVTASSAKTESSQVQIQRKEKPGKRDRVASVHPSSSGSESDNEASYSEGEIRSHDKDKKSRNEVAEKRRRSPPRKKDVSPSRPLRSSPDRNRLDRRKPARRRDERRQSPARQRSPSPKRRRRSTSRDLRRRGAGGNDDRKETRRVSPMNRDKSLSPRSRREKEVNAQRKRSPNERRKNSSKKKRSNSSSSSASDSSVERKKRRLKREQRKKDGKASSSSSSSSPSPRRLASVEKKRTKEKERRRSASRERNNKQSRRSRS